MPSSRERSAPALRAPSLAQFSGPSLSMVWARGAIHLRAPEPSGDLPEPHAHFAMQVSVAIHGSIAFRSVRADAPRFAEGWLIGSDKRHWMIGSSPVATIFYDPLSAAGQRLVPKLDNTGVLPLAPNECATVRARLEKCWQCGWRSLEVQALADKIALTLAPGPLKPVRIDERVQKVIDRLVLDPGERTGVDDLAAGVGLSESRLEHLFREQVGLPIRQYRMTLRMQDAAEQLAEGHSLIEAAHNAGFADSSHFCRICRRMFGVAPSRLPMRK